MDSVTDKKERKIEMDAILWLLGGTVVGLMI